MGGCCAPGGGVLVAACASQKQQHVTSTRARGGGKVRGAGAEDGPGLVFPPRPGLLCSLRLAPSLEPLRADFVTITDWRTNKFGVWRRPERIILTTLISLPIVKGQLFRSSY